MPADSRLPRVRLRSHDGQTLIEYAALAALVAIAAVIFLAAIGLDIAEIFDAIENWLGVGAENAVTPEPGVSDETAPAGAN